MLDNPYIKLLLIFLLLIVLFYNIMPSYEYLTATSNESLQSLSSVYNTGNMSVTNLTVTGNYNIGAMKIGSDGTLTMGKLTITPDGSISNGAINTGSLNSSSIVNSGNFSTAGLSSSGTATIPNLSSTNITSTNITSNNIIGTSFRGGTLFGAYMVNASNSKYVGGWYPISSSASDYYNIGVPHSQGDSYLLMPGYKITVYNTTNFTGKSVTFDNTNGTNIVSYSMNGTPVGVNSDVSCQLYYMGNQI